MTVTSNSPVDDPAAAGPATADPAAVPSRPAAPARRTVDGIGEPSERGEPSSAAPKRTLGYRRQRFEARRVRRLVRHIDPWSVLKLSLLLALCMWLVSMIASVIIWSVANNTGALASLERFVNENLQLEDFELTGSVLFRQFGLISLLAALGFAAAMVVTTLVFNLISDIIGGVWVSVIEEETARPIVEARSQPD